MKIVFTGPECSGKTDLSTFIAKKYSFGFVREVAREYLKNHNNIYDYESLFEISELQIAECRSVGQNYQTICCDTDLLTIIIWSEEKFGTVDPLIPEFWKADYPDLYFLCAPDIPWEYDPQRENPYDRDRLFDIHKNILLSNDLTFHIVSGDFEKRVIFVSDILDHMKLKSTYL